MRCDSRECPGHGQRRKVSSSRRSRIERVTAFLRRGAALRAVRAAQTSPPLSGVAAIQIKFKAIKVDGSALPGKALEPEAEWLERDLPGLFRGAFAGRSQELRVLAAGTDGALAARERAGLFLAK
jgi:hypothetical protein